MVRNAWTNNRRSTIDGYEFQEHVAGCGWQESHTDIGYNVMLENKRAYEDNQRLGGNPFRIVKRKLKKADYTPESHRMMERADLTALVERLTKLIAERPDSKRNRNRQWQIEQANKRIESLGTC